VPLKTILFGLSFAIALTAAALYAPVWGVCAYVLNYSIGPERQWWAVPLRQWDIRFSFMLAGATALGAVLHYRRLRFGRFGWMGQEKLLLLFLSLVWLSTLIGEPTVGAYTVVDHPTVKMTKIIIFVLLLTHIVTELKSLDLLLWTMVLSALWLGVEAYRVPYGAFQRGRLEGVGGPDFTEANFLGAYVAALLPIVGVQLLQAKWRGKLFCLVAGVFATNLLVLTRSRGAVVGLAVGGFTALLLAPRWARVKIAAGLVIALLGGLYLSDAQFLNRAATITRSEDQRDVSAQSRINLTRVGLQMLADYPQGIGAGNYFQVIGRYIPQYRGKDAHNTYLRCATELGLQGGAVFVLLIINALRTLRRVAKQAAAFPEEARQKVVYLCYGLAVCMSVLFGCCLTMSLTYVEYLWWILALPVCLERAVQNLQLDTELVPEVGRSGTCFWTAANGALH